MDSESDDDYEYEAAEAELIGSGDDKPDHDKDGECSSSMRRVIQCINANVCNVVYRIMNREHSPHRMK